MLEQSGSENEAQEDAPELGELEAALVQGVPEEGEMNIRTRGRRLTARLAKLEQT